MVCSGLRPDDVRYFAAIEIVMECMQDAGEGGAGWGGRCEVGDGKEACVGCV